jgi:RNA polymerase sigma-70 factor (ECF subfamily)
MTLVDVHDGSTSPTLLSNVADWEDHPAWVRFRDTYHPRLVRWCSGYGLGAEAIDEICQRIWCELAWRMRTFEYDPSGSFRGWLRRLCESRVLNYLRERRSHRPFSLDEREDDLAAGGGGIACKPADTENEGEDAPDPDLRLILDAGKKIQSAVGARVKPHNWEAFLLVAIYDWSVGRTAQALGMTRAAVYAAKERISRMLRDEGARVLDQRAAGA